MSDDPADAPLPRLLAFGRVLRRRGLDVHVGRMLDVVEALSRIDISRRDDVYHVCRALLVHRQSDLAAFERAFHDFWAPAWRHADGAVEDGAGETRAVPTLSASPAGREAASYAASPIEAPSSGGEAEALDVPAWSDVEALASKDFADFTDAEVASARAAFERLDWQPRLRRTRRWLAGRGAGLDVRRALARSVRTGGDVASWPRRARTRRPRPLVLLCDVSGSMEIYSRILIHFAYAVTRRHRRVEAFLFSTRLTRITRHLRRGRLDEAVRAVSRAVHDWGGGTRIGASLEEFQRVWGRRTLTRGPVVLLVSDGWDRGEPGRLAAATARLQRSCHRLIWLNPLVGTPGYEPLTRGLQAALPYVDDFRPVRTLRDVAELAAVLAEEPAPK